MFSDIPFGGNHEHNSSFASLSEVLFSDYGVRDVFYAVLGVVTFEMEVLFGVCWFVVNFCDNLAILVF